jgi:tetratricopeptide (TPR) repeat protein
MRMLHITAALILTFMVSGCGPTVRLQRLKPAEIDMSSMRRLVVLDFDYYRGDVDSVEDFVVGIIARGVGVSYGEDHQVREAASYAADELVDALRGADYFEIVDSTQLRNVHLRGAADVEKISRSLGADAILAGDLDYAECRLEDFFEEEKIYDAAKKQEVIRYIPWVRQNCRLTISYRVIRIEGNVLEVKKRFSEYHEEEVEESQLHTLKDPEHWYQEMIDGIIPQIAHQLAPYEISETRHLKKDKTYDAHMERAMALTKAGNLTQARDLFIERWYATANPAAGCNAAILYEAEGDLDNAVKLLGEVIEISNDYTILREHRLVLEALEERRMVEEQLQ